MKDASPPGCMTRRPVKPEPVAAPEARCVFVNVSLVEGGWGKDETGECASPTAARANLIAIVAVPA